MPRVLQVVARRTGKKVDIETITGWNLAKSLPLSNRQIQKLFGYVWSNGNWRRIKPMERGVGRKVSELGKYGKVNIVTSAAVDQVPGKMKWLDHHGIREPFVVVGYGQTKEMLEHEVYIDDRPETIERVVADMKIGILYDRPWNRSCKSGIRVHNLDEAIEVVRRVRVEHQLRLEVKNMDGLELASAVSRR